MTAIRIAELCRHPLKGEQHMNALYYYDPDTDQMKAVLVEPPAGYKDDTDYQLRNLAHKAEGEARKARNAGRNWDADYFAALAASSRTCSMPKNPQQESSSSSPSASSSV